MEDRAQKSPTSPVTDSISRVDNDIAVGEDLAFQRRWWSFERFIWFVFTCIVILDALGAFGRGYLARDHLRTADGTIDMHYERIQRTTTPSIVRIQFGPTAVHNGLVQLFVSESLIRELGNRRIIPQPASSVIEPNGILYTFPVGRGPGSAAFQLEPEGPGLFPLVLQVPGSERLTTRIFVVP